MPALPGKIINKALGVSVKRARVGVGAGRLRNISGGADLITDRIDMLMAARGAMLRTAILRTAILSGGIMVLRCVRCVGSDCMRVDTPVGIMRGSRGDPSGCGVRGGEVPSEQPATLTVVDFAVGLAPGRDDI